WIVVPAGAVAVGETPIYDNLRHLLFIIPAFFLLGCLGLQWLVRILERWSLPAAAVGLLLLPSLVGIVTLHPYEYAYYNVLIGGVKGASGRYALDYWCTSFREAINHVNGVAPAGASLMALGPERVVRRFVRSDIEMLSKHQTSEAPDFMLTC
ncbi:MAG: hypothetical protein GWN58_38150, partial [Anaerolineae bacterium]|nr:hypothetical protein [Anaerolineae bacterium]